MKNRRLVSIEVAGRTFLAIRITRWGDAPVRYVMSAWDQPGLAVEWTSIEDNDVRAEAAADSRVGYRENAAYFVVVA